MEYLVLSMIVAGSMLMVYNIIAYSAFIKRSNDLDHKSGKRGALLVPLFLLLFFLIGYVVVGVIGVADLLIASILLGGSIFVFLLLRVMFSVIRHIRETENILAARYAEMKDQIKNITKDSTAVFLVNLTKDEIEDRSGENLSDSDLDCSRYTELLESRRKTIIEAYDKDADRTLFTRDGLLKHYLEGQTNASEILLVRRKDGVASFAKIEATLTKIPVTGDVMAFIVEKPYNDEVIREVLLKKVLADQYDRVAYIIDGNYKALINNTRNKEGLLLSDDEEDTYESLYLNNILPALSREMRSPGSPNPLRLSVIEKELSDKDFYEVDLPFFIKEKKYFKRFVFYCVDRKARFYLMLLSDSTGIQEEQERRTRELSEALAEAVRSNESRVAFFTNLSHDLRTPMNGILGYTELAKNEKDVEKIKEYLDKIALSGNRLLSFVNDLFAMSVISSGSYRPETIPLDIGEELEAVLKRAVSGVPEKEVGTDLDFSGLKHPRVFCDQNLFLHVIGQLADNAAAFAPPKSSVSLTASEEEIIGEKTVYSIKISGKGKKIPESVIDRLFEAQSWNAGKDVGSIPGIGLGMTVAKAYSDALGAKISLTANSDEKIEFTVRVLLTRQPEEPENRDKNRTKGLKLLVVDDNEINREIAELMLSSEGYTVTLASDGREAVKKIEECAPGSFDAVLMDVQMPVMNGHEATRAIRALKDEKRASLPIIAMTANAYQEDRSKAQEAGMNGYVCKPINIEEIAKALEKALSGQ